MTSFSNRNPIPIAVVGIVVLALITMAAYRSDDLPVIGGGTTYTAAFSEAAGLSAGDPVYVAGIEVGRVSEVRLDGDRVLVSLRVADAWIGDETTAAIQIRTLLGAKYVSLDPQGDSVLDPDDTIPLQRTTSPYDVVEAFNGLSGTIDDIDTAQLAQSMRVLSDTFRGTSEEVRGALDGLSRLSETIASRDRQLERLLANTRNVSGVLADRNAEFERLIQDGNLLLEEVRLRRDAISALLTNTQRLSQELRGLVADNGAQLRPALEQLDRVAAVLQRNQDNLNEALRLEATFVRVFANVLSNGRWFDSYVCGLVPPEEYPVINNGGC